MMNGRFPRILSFPGVEWLGWHAPWYLAFSNLLPLGRYMVTIFNF